MKFDIITWIWSLLAIAIATWFIYSHSVLWPVWVGIMVVNCLSLWNAGRSHGMRSTLTRIERRNY